MVLIQLKSKYWCRVCRTNRLVQVRKWGDAHTHQATMPTAHLHEPSVHNGMAQSPRPHHQSMSNPMAEHKTMSHNDTAPIPPPPHAVSIRARIHGPQSSHRRYPDLHSRSCKAIWFVHVSTGYGFHPSFDRALRPSDQGRSHSHFQSGNHWWYRHLSCAQSGFCRRQY